MITILIGIILIVFAIKNYDNLAEELFALALIVGGIIIVCGVLIPMAGFTEPTVQEIELLPLKLEEETDKTYYTKYQNGYYLYAYDNSGKYGLSGTAYEQSKVQNNNLKIYESEDCTTPILKIFKSKSKISWYSLAGMWSDEEYVFYIPVGTKYVPTE